MMKKIFALFLLFFLPCKVFAQDFFEAGKKEFYKQNYSGAQILFLQELQNNPENYSCRYFLAHTYVFTDDLLRAKQEYGKIITFSPNKSISKLAMQSMYNLNHNTSESLSQKAFEGENYLDFVKMNGNYVKWTQMPINVYVVPSDYSSLVKNAFSNWQKALDGVLSFNFTGNINNAQITVSMTDTLSTQGKTSQYEAGLATIQAKNNVIYRADIQLLKINPSTSQPLSESVVYSTALHEIGHAIGLQGHSPNDSDIMSAINYVGKKSLSARDVNTVLMLYRK